ncbi:MAG: ADP-ribosylation factor-like protein [Promethearchaeota archaeon]
MADSKKELIKSIVLSIFDEEGPSPIVYWPESLDETSSHLIAMKTISLLMGDAVYQDGENVDGINYFGILPFPDIGLNGLTYFFLISDERARGQAKAATITILIDERNNSFFYSNMKYLRILLDKTATNVQTTLEFDKYSRYMDELREELNEFTSELKDPFFSNRKLKIIMAGLDKAGKSSFLKGVKKKYSEIIKILPTKGVDRTEEKLFEEQNSQISIWDLGGQKQYRDKYLENSKIYLYNVDLIFYLIDIQDTKRMDHSLELFRDIINTLKQFDEYPPIVICFNKFDPDIKNSDKLIKISEQATQEIKKYSDNFFIKVFHTSIFDHYSLITAYSFGLSQLSPNRELFLNQLRNLANRIDAGALLLINDNGIILSNFSKISDKVSDKVFEISAPHFQTLYKTFKEFKLLKKDFIMSTGITDDSKKIVFKKINVGKYNLYLLFFIESEFGMDKLDQFLPDFSLNLTELMKTYL